MSGHHQASMKRQPTSSSGSNSSATADPPITAPPRVALARDRKTEAHKLDGSGLREKQHSLMDAAHAVPDAMDTDRAEPRTGSAQKEQAMHTKWDSRATGVSNVRKSKGSRSSRDPSQGLDLPASGFLENKARGMPTSGRPGASPVLHAASTQVAEAIESRAGLDEASVQLHEDIDQALEAASEERRKLQDRLEQSQEQQQRLEEQIRRHQVQLSENETKIDELEGLLDEQKKDTTFWAKKHEEVHRQYIKTDSEYRMLQTHLADRDTLWKRDWVRKNEHLLIERDRCRDGFHASQKLLQERDVEVEELRRQVLELKHSISTSTRTEGQVTDDVFREKISTLGHDLQNWIIINFRKAKFDFDKLPASVRDELAAIGVLHSCSGSLSKLHLLQSIVSALLVRDIFHPYFFGLSDERVERLKETESFLESLGPPNAVNHWRSTTLTLVRHSSTPEIETYSSELISELQSRIGGLIASLTGRAQSPSSSVDTREAGLRAILLQAMSLAQLFRVQRANFTADMPLLGSTNPIKFDHQSMEDFSGEEETHLNGREVQCVIFPAVWKTGDENGDNLHLRNVITKAKVLCQAS